VVKPIIHGMIAVFKPLFFLTYTVIAREKLNALIARFIAIA